MSINQAKSAGFRVYVKHRRRYVSFDRFSGQKTEHFCRVEDRPDGADINKGGYTVVEAVDEKGNIYEGTAVCGNNEAFCKKIGVQIALGRALKEVPQFQH